MRRARGREPVLAARKTRGYARWSPMEEFPHRTLEQLLIEQGRITQDDLRKVKRLQQERGERLERRLRDLGFSSEEDLLPLLSAYLAVETIHRRDFPTAPVPLGNLNLKFLKHAKVLPLAQTNGGLTVAMSDPADYYTIQGLQLATGLQVEPRLARERDVLEALETIYGGGNAEGGAAAEPADAELEYFGDDEEDVDHLRDLASEAPVIRFVNLLISRAVEQRASDIHIEPFENELKVRYRIDGVLHDVEAPQRRLQAAIVSRVKIMSKLNIAERRLPQDGRIKLRLMGREIGDAETAEIAIQAALTGHLVFSTLHTNDAAGAVSRLLEMGVEDYLLASSLLGVLAQRLVRKVCSKCRRPAEVTAAVMREIGGNGAAAEVYEGEGCDDCARTGYRGRSGIFEILLVNDVIRPLILKRSSADIIKDASVQQGMRTLREDGWQKVRTGVTTVAEVVRVTQEEV